MHPAELFLKTLDPTADKFVFQVFKELDGGGGARTLYGSFPQLQDQLNDLNRNGFGIYVTVNQTKGNRRKKADILAARAIWIEQDTEAPAELPIEPQIIVNTSLGHYHKYYLIEPTEDLDTWAKVMDVMVKHYGCDPNARDLSRVLRVPGFTNHKRDFEVELSSCDTGATRYDFAEIVKQLKIHPKDPVESVGGKPSGPQGLDRYVMQIKAGEHLHGPIRDIMFINANNGCDRTYNKMICTGLIALWTGEPERKEKAIIDLDSMLDATYKKLDAEISVENEDDDEIEITGNISDRIPALGIPKLEWPPGLMGELARSANEFFAVPNKTVATITAISLVAGIIGRRYNVSNSGLNLYSTVMLPTGAGKDSIRKFCQQVLMDSFTMGTNGLSFLGPQNFTGPKALLNELYKRPAMLCVLTEAGLLYKSDSGDGTGLTRVILQAYTSSGEREFISAEKYSSTDNSIPTVLAPALTILHEATPITLIKELEKRESINTGELPRMWIFMETGKKPYNNPYPHNLNLSQGLQDRLKSLLVECSLVQNSERPDVVHLDLPQGFIEYSNWCTDQYNELMDENSSKAVMYTRAAHKVLKTAAICSVLDGYDTVTQEAWEWSKHLLEYELANIDPIIGNSNPVTGGVAQAANFIKRLLEGHYKGRNHTLSEELRKRNIFSRSAFLQVTNNCRAISDLGTSAKYGNPKSGQRVVLDYLLNEGHMYEVKDVPGFRMRRKNEVWYRMSMSTLKRLLNS